MARRARDYRLKLRLINLPKEERNVSPDSTASSLMVPTPPPQLCLPLGSLNFGNRLVFVEKLMIGRKISVSFETPDTSTSFLNRRAEPAPQAPKPKRNQRQQQWNNGTTTTAAPVASAPATPHPMVIDGTQGFVPKLYSDVMLIRSGQKKR